jgi:MFS family permease
MLIGIASFCVGSVLCGLAWSMPALIAFRVVQGVGAGAVQPMAFTILGDVYSVAERAKAQAYTASVWGGSAVVGPTVGGVFAEYLSWRWIFLVNIPICAVTAYILMRSFRDLEVRSDASVDYIGAALLVPACSLLVLAMLEGGQSWPWWSPAGVVLPATGLLLALAFVAVQRKVTQPLLPLWVFKKRLLLSTSLAAAAVGAVVLGLTSYIPTFLQGARGVSPIVAGMALAALSVGWPVSASQSGRLYLRVGFRRCALVGALIVLVGCLMLMLIDGGSSVIQVAATCFVIGLGMGLVAAPTLIAAQSSVEWHARGVVTGNILFCRSLGSAVGVAIFGAIANWSLGDQATGREQPSAGAVAIATHYVFLAVVPVSLAMVAAVVAMPRGNSASGAQP